MVVVGKQQSLRFSLWAIGIIPAVGMENLLQKYTKRVKKAMHIITNQQDQSLKKLRYTWKKWKKQEITTILSTNSTE